MTDKRIHDLAEATDIEATDELVIFDVSDDTQSPEGSTKKILANTLYNRSGFFGWAFYDDSQYTSMNPLAVTADTRTLLPNNASGVNTEVSYLKESQPLFVNDTITPVAVGDSYMVRVSFKAIADTNNSGVRLDLDIGASPAQINVVSVYQRFQRNSGLENLVSFSFPIFCLQTFINNGGKIYIQSIAGLDVYDISIYIGKIFRNITT